jgi:hypothetical protein
MTLMEVFTSHDLTHGRPKSFNLSSCNLLSRYLLPNYLLYTVQANELKKRFKEAIAVTLLFVFPLFLKFNVISISVI